MQQLFTLTGTKSCLTANQTALESALLKAKMCHTGLSEFAALFKRAVCYIQKLLVNSDTCGCKVNCSQHPVTPWERASIGQNSNVAHTRLNLIDRHHVELAFQ